MTRSTDVSNQTLRAAQNTNTQLQQLADTVAMLAANQTQTQQQIADIHGQMSAWML